MIETYCLVETKEKECFEVVVANAISYPWTVMVHLGHANVANAAMMRALGLPVSACLAVHVLVVGCRLRNHFRPFESSDRV